MGDFVYIHSQLHISHCLTGSSLRDMKMGDFVYIHSQLHISHCLTGSSLRDMKMGVICSKD
jgi:hypothetical protein